VEVIFLAIYMLGMLYLALVICGWMDRGDDG